MPAPADQLTEQYRVQQATIGATTALLMLQLWDALQVDRADEERTALWLAAVARIVLSQRAQSALLGQAYVRTVRRLELPGVPDFTPTPLELEPQAITSSMYATGLVPLRKAREAEQARTGEPATTLPRPRVEKLKAATAAAAQRHVLNGGRSVIDDAVTSDPKAIGYLRIGDGDPCYWCAMLNSRGPVYKGDSFERSDPRFHGPGDAKCHDGCGCSLRPLYSRPDLADTDQPELERQWVAATAGASGKRAILAFRRTYEGRAAR